MNLFVVSLLLFVPVVVLLAVSAMRRAADRDARWNGNRIADMRASDNRDSGPVFWGDSGSTQNGASDGANDAAGASGQWNCDSSADAGGASSSADSCCPGDFGSSDFSGSDFSSSDCGSSSSGSD